MRFGIPIHLLPKNSEEKEIKINIDYDAYILSLIKTGLSTENPALFKELFGKPTQKNYSTSVFFPNATFTKDNIVLDKNGEMKWNYIWVQISYVMPVKASVQYDKTCEFIDDVKVKDNALIVCFDVEYMPNNWSGIFEVSNGISTKIIKLRRQGSQNFIFAD